MSTTVHVEGISSQTTEKEVRDFFSFCGKISDISVKPTSNEANASFSATVTFEKENAAKTALLLDNTQLGPSQVTVKSTASLSDLAATSKSEDAGDEDLGQDDKPRSRIIAEYLAHGYVISDKIIERALALDQQHGVSSRFTKTLTDFDSRYKATEKTKVLDDKYGVSKSATTTWNSLSSYFDSALNNPTGQKLRTFYQQGNKQVIDVHNEARHLANLKSGKPNTSSVAETPAAPAPADAQSSTTPATASAIPPPTTGAVEKPGLGDKI